MDNYAKGDKVILGKYVKDAKIHQDRESFAKLYARDCKIRHEKGTSVKVYRCRSMDTGVFFALKKTPDLKPSEKEGIPPTTLQEIDLRKKLRHRNVIMLLDMKEYVDKHHRPAQYLVYEYMESDLNKHIDFHLNESNTNIPTMVIKKLMYQLFSGLAYCHKKQGMHRNLKPSNLLINEDNGLLKIGDFGLGRGYVYPNRHYTLNVSTPWYRAPEMLLGATDYSYSVDIWAVGCIFAELYKRRPLFQSSKDLQIHAIFKILGTPNENVWPGVTQLKYWHEFIQWKPVKLVEEVPDMEEQEEGLDLLSQMLQYDPGQRISAEAAIRHRYFSDIRNMLFSYNEST